jgi:hypothetical protein
MKNKWIYISCIGSRKMTDEECKEYMNHLNMDIVKRAHNGKFLIPSPISDDYDKDLYNLIESKKQEYIKSCQTT